MMLAGKMSPRLELEAIARRSCRPTYVNIGSDARRLRQAYLFMNGCMRSANELSYFVRAIEAEMSEEPHLIYVQRSRGVDPRK